MPAAWNQGRANEMVDDTAFMARGTGPTAADCLRVCAPVTFARLHIVPNLPTFLSAHPDLAIEMAIDDTNLDLAETDIDIALRMGDLPDAAHPARKIGESRRVVLGAPAYFARAGEPLTPDDLIAHQAIIYDQAAGGVDWTFRRGPIATSVTITGRVHVPAAEGVREAVFAGLGLTVASEWMFARELASGAVRRVLQDWTLPPIGLWALFPKGRDANATARVFADFIEDQLRKSRAR